MDSNKNQKENREGQVFYNTNKQKFTVINYINANEVQVEFESGYKTWTRWDKIKKGYVRDMYSMNKSGYILDMSVSYSNDPIIKIIYSQFINMHTREVSDNYHNSRPLSVGTTICQEWTYFSNYYNWASSQPNLPFLIKQTERICLDKDILVKNNKLYSPTTCCIVPSSINVLICTHPTVRGDLPLGVTWACQGQKVIAKWQNPITKEAEWSSVFPNTPEGIEEAFYIYKYHREKYIKEKANLYYKNNFITKECYDALLNYTVSIDD